MHAASRGKIVNTWEADIRRGPANPKKFNNIPYAIGGSDPSAPIVGIALSQDRILRIADRTAAHSHALCDTLFLRHTAAGDGPDHV